MRSCWAIKQDQAEGGQTEGTRSAEGPGRLGYFAEAFAARRPGTHHWMHAVLHAPDALNGGDVRAGDGGQRGEAGVDGAVLHAAGAWVDAGAHHGAGAAPALPRGRPLPEGKTLTLRPGNRGRGRWRTSPQPSLAPVSRASSRKYSSSVRAGSQESSTTLLPFRRKENPVWATGSVIPGGHDRSAERRSGGSAQMCRDPQPGAHRPEVQRRLLSEGLATR